MASKDKKSIKNPFERFLRDLLVKFNSKDLTVTLKFPKKINIDPNQPQTIELEQKTIPITNQNNKSSIIIENTSDIDFHSLHADTSENIDEKNLGSNKSILENESSFKMAKMNSNSNEAKEVIEIEPKEIIKLSKPNIISAKDNDDIFDTDLTDITIKSQPNQIQFNMKAYIKIALHALKYANQNINPTKWVEVIGLLTGYIKNKDTPLACIYVTDAFPIGHGTDVNVQIQNPQSHVKVYNEKDKKEMIVGWYHSHPSYGAFMSQTDYLTQLRYQKLAPGNQATQPIALVIDPTKINKQSYGFKIFRLKDNYKKWEKPGFEVLNLQTKQVPDMLETLLPLSEGKAMFLEYE